MCLRDLCHYFPETVYTTLQHYAPFLATIADKMNESSSLFLEIWCMLEAAFYILLKWKIRYLQTRDPLEASLSAAPMMEPADRRTLWDRIMEIEKDDPVAFLSGWFFDQDIKKISRYDVCDFLCWSMFDGRNQEHLTIEELEDLECFVEDLEYSISIHLHGTEEQSENENDLPERGFGRRANHQHRSIPLKTAASSGDSDSNSNKENSENSYPYSSDLQSSEGLLSDPFTPERANRILKEEHSHDPLGSSGRFFTDKPKPKQSKEMFSL
jgi:hypothetical protein